MKRLLIFFIFLLPACAWFSTPSKTIVGSGNRIRESRELSDATELEVHGTGMLFFKQANKNLLVIEADDNLLPHIVSQSSGDDLKIGPARNTHLKSKQPIKYFLTLKNIEEIDLSGAVYLKAERITTDDLEIKTSGASRIDATIMAQDLEIESSGASKLNLRGKVEAQQIDISGACQYNAGSMQSKEADVKVSGTARVTVHAIESLKVDASGVAFVAYRGTPEVEIKTSGASSVKNVGK